MHSASDFSRHPEPPPPSRTGPQMTTYTVTERIWRPVIDAMPCLLERGEVVEQFRGLRSRLVQFRQESPLKSILISSGMPAEGKSFVCVNLAISLARHNASRVLLIDGDLRQPTLHYSLGSVPTPGLSEYLSGAAELSEVLQCNEMPQTREGRMNRQLPHLTFIPAGTPRNTSSDLLLNSRMTNLLVTLAPEFDWILIDSPPVLAVSDALELARNSDAVMLVAREGHTPFSVARRAQAAFQNANLLGFVLNGATRGNHSHYSSYYSDYSASSLLATEVTAISQ